MRWYFMGSRVRSYINVLLCKGISRRHNVHSILKLIVMAGLSCLAFVSVQAVASEAVFTYNPARSGEGAAIFVEKETLVLTFFTFTDSVVSYPPTVSPSPPPVEAVCLNRPIWYVGVATNWDGDAGSGKLYADRPYDYPFAIGRAVSESEEIGDFVISRDREGFDFYVDWVANNTLPYSVSLYDTVYQLWLPLVTVRGN
jgi:hypothetical protein